MSGVPTSLNSPHIHLSLVFPSFSFSVTVSVTLLCRNSWLTLANFSCCPGHDGLYSCFSYRCYHVIVIVFLYLLMLIHHIL